MEKIITFFILSAIFFNCNKVPSNQYEEKLYDVLVMEDSTNQNLKYLLTGEVFMYPSGGENIQNFKLHIYSNNIAIINYSLPTIKMPIIKTNFVDNDLLSDLYIIIYSGGMHVNAIQQIVYSTKYKKLFISDMIKVKNGIYSNFKINYSIETYPDIHGFFNKKTNFDVYIKEFNNEMNPKKYRRIQSVFK